MKCWPSTSARLRGRRRRRRESPETEKRRRLSPAAPFALMFATLLKVSFYSPTVFATATVTAIATEASGAGAGAAARLRTRFVDGQVATTVVVVIQLRDRVLRILVGRHL